MTYFEIGGLTPELGVHFGYSKVSANAIARRTPCGVRIGASLRVQA